MPSVRKKRAQNKQNYLRNKEIRRKASHTKYWANLVKKGAASQASNNTDKKRAADRASYWKNPDKKRAASRARYWKNPESERAFPGHTRYWEDPEKARASSRASSHMHYWHPPVPIIGRTLIKQGQLPVCLPVLVIGGTPVRKGQQST